MEMSFETSDSPYSHEEDITPYPVHIPTAAPVLQPDVSLLSATASDGFSTTVLVPSASPSIQPRTSTTRLPLPIPPSVPLALLAPLLTI